jgi:LysR family nitrogen assimilation transcriptional regulator
MEVAVDLETLKLLLAVAEHGSFTRAAIKLGMTQPTISKRIQQMEELLGTRLLYRHGRGVNLTEAGNKLANVARTIFVQLEAIKEELQDGEQQLQGWVVLGLPPSLGASLSVPLARQFRERFPCARLRIVEAFSGSLLELLEAGKIDVGVLYDARLSPTMLVNPLLRENLYLVDRGDCEGPLDPVSIDELGVGSFVLSNASNGLRRVVNAAASMAGITMDVAVEIDSLTALKRIAELGPERSILPYGAIYREVEEGKLRARPFDGRGLNALLVSATPLHRPVRRLAKELHKLLVEQVDSCIKAGVLTGIPL